MANVNRIFIGNTILPLLCLINVSSRLKHLVLSMKKRPYRRTAGTRAASLTEPPVGDGEQHFKTSSADFRTKVNVIKANAHKCSVSAMCKVLSIPRSTYYYELK